MDLQQLSGFLSDTQPGVAEALTLGDDGPVRRKFMQRLSKEVSKRGVVDVLRNGLGHGQHQIDLFYGTPSPGNTVAAELYGTNRFTVTRQLRYSRDERQRALDLALLVNGLPVATFELKNSLTKQTVADAVQQYRRDRDPREPLFQLGRCMAHFAVDDQEVRFCTHLQGKASWFLPFNRGWNDGAGNPPNPDGIKTDYLWREVLTRASLTNVIENYAQKTISRNDSAGRSTRQQIWPRYHQLQVVRQLLAHAREHGAGQRYLIQHSAGSGKSNSIAWLSHQLVGLRRDQLPVFDSVIVVTDRRVLDQQISDTIKQFAQVSATVGHADRSRDLRRMIEGGKKIIISTVQKFPEILDKIGGVQADRKFAIIIDEAHSSQGGRTSAAMSRALSGDSRGLEADEEADEETFEDKINRLIEARRMLPNASYYAFTATPKNKTLEMFGAPLPQPDGTVRHVPFHSYTMKQAIQEGFIVDVLAHYTPVQSYYRLTKTVEGDPRFDTRRAHRKLRRYVESHDHAVRLKAEIMVDHFHEKVLGQRKIGGTARAMVVADGVKRAIQYHNAISAYLAERKSPHRALVAFSGEREFGGSTVSEASLNGFPSAQIAERFRQEPYRLLICADKFQTGYDEPLLHTMYVDKLLSGIKAVQTLSRLNRAHPDKHDAFVLDFTNDADTIRDAFEPYYRSTVLADETDPDKLHDIVADLCGHQIYAQSQVDSFAEAFLDGVPRDQLDPILDECVAAYLSQLAEDQQVDFKGNAKAFLRTYGFLAAVLPYGHPEWEKLSIFLNFLVPKLPAPQEDDLSRGVLEAVDMDSYRAEKQQAMQINLADEDGEIDPVPTGGGGHLDEPELDLLSNIIASFNQLFGNIEWEDDDRVHRLITEEIPQKVNADVAYQNAREHSDEQNARIEHDRALRAVMTAILSDDAQLFRLYSDNESFKRWLTDTIFDLTYRSLTPIVHENS
ncbi:MAG: type I restriction endonuclease subunit R [Acidimicrobiaceae bacterium]|nr:type I restriction endonuclease subunit R [Acidimicrobiaceae bacterium]